MEKELEFISGRFFTEGVPPSHRWLLNYYTTPLEVQFLRYYFIFCENSTDSVFKQYYYFRDRTGCVMTKRFFDKLRDYFKFMMEVIEQAEKEGDYEKIAFIKSGKFQWRLERTKRGKGKNSKFVKGEAHIRKCIKRPIRQAENKTHPILTFYGELR